MVNVLNCDIDILSEFELQSHYYVHFWINTLGKGMNYHPPPHYGLNGTTTILLQG